MKPVLVISERDNVATALEPLTAGRRLEIGGREVLVAEAIAAGHKIAIDVIAKGDEVIKYGSPIGIAVAEIRAGAHVHTHNVASGRGRGDLARSSVVASEPEVRLAEPPDECQAPEPITNEAPRKR